MKKNKRGIIRNYEKHSITQPTESALPVFFISECADDDSSGKRKNAVTGANVKKVL